jgi:hypothetical protein
MVVFLSIKGGHMRHTWLALALGVVVCTNAVADIADNFMAGGIGFSGNGSFSDDVGDPTDSSNEYNHLTVSFNPSVVFYVVDFLAFAISPSFTYASNYTNSNNHIPSLTYGLGVGFSWFPMFDPGHLFQKDSWKYNPNYPLVFNLGFNVGVAMVQYLSGVVGGKTVSGDSLQLYVGLTPSIGIYYFISERYAVDLLFNPQLSIPVGVYASAGSPFDYPPLNSAHFTYSASIGITVFVPWGELSLIKK